MRKSIRMLAFVMTLLMVVGMLPFAVFAEDGGAELSYDEKLNAYVTKEGGTVLYKNDFSANANGLSLVPKKSTIAVDGGYLKITSSDVVGPSNDTNDPYVNYGSSAINEGDPVVVELALRIDELAGKDVNIIQFIDREISPKGSLFQTVLYFKEDLTLRNTLGDVVGTFEVGKTVNIKVVMIPAINAVHYYINGEFASASALTTTANFQDYYGNANRVRKMHKLNELRLCQIGNAGKGAIALDSLYIYKGVTVPFEVNTVAPGKETYTDFASFLLANKSVMFAGSDFELGKASVNSNGKTATLYPQNAAEGKPVALFDAYYDLVNGDFTASAGGTGWSYVGSNGMTMNLVIKLTTAEFRKEADGNTYYHINCGWPRTLDTLVDSHFVKSYVKGDDFVVSADVRADAKRNNNFSLFGITQRCVGGGADNGGINRASQYLLKINPNGEVVLENDNKVVVGQILENVFTNIACVVHPKTNSFDVYINGVCTSTGNTFLNAKNLTIYKDGYAGNGGNVPAFGGYGEEWYNNYAPGEMRAVNCSTQGNGIQGDIDVDNIRAYTGSAVYGATTEYKTGWSQDTNGFWRYYDEYGVAAVGETVIDGVTYYFNGDGYFSEAERVSLVDIKTVMESSKYVAFGAFAASTEVIGSSKYTALWSQWYKEGAIIDTKFSDKDASTNVGISATVNGVNPSLVKKNASIPALTSGALNIMDLSGYDALEINWYINRPANFQIKLIMHSPSLQTSAYGYVEGRDPYTSGNIGRPCYLKDDSFKINEADGVSGWNSTLVDIRYGANKVPGAQSTSVSRLGRVDAITSINFSLDWDSSQGKGGNNNVDSNHDGLEWYLDSINVIRYVPSETDPRTLSVVRVDGGSTYIYKDYASDYSKGWQTVGDDTYYCNVYDGKAVTGLQVIKGKAYQFDDTGKLVDDTASGVYTIGGLTYVYVDGVLQKGEFNYGGVNYYTDSNGAVYSKWGKVPYAFAEAYEKVDYSAVSSLLIYEDFTGRTGYLGRNDLEGGATYNAGNSAKSTYVGGNNAQLVVRNTRFYFVDNGNGGVALKCYNKSQFKDSYINLNLEVNNSGNKDIAYFTGAMDGENKVYEKTDIVFEATVKLGDDWHTSATFAQLIDRRDAKRDFDVAVLNEQGYLYNSDGIICKLSTEEYTRISFAYRVDTKVCDIYVNGVKVDSLKCTNGSYIAPSEIRCLQYYTGDAFHHGTIFVDSLAIYLASEPVGVKTAELKNGLVNEYGYLRYYVNGLIKTGLIDVDGKQMMFDSVNGSALTGFSGDYYYENGYKCEYVGIMNIDGADYYFNSDYRFVKNATVTVGMKTYTADANGVLTEVKYVSAVTDILSAFEIANGSEVGKLEYNNAESALVYNHGGLNNGFSANFAAPADLSSADAVRLNMYIGGDAAIDADIGIILGTAERFTAAEVSVADDGTITIISLGDTEYIKADIPNAGKLVDTTKYTTFGGVKYRMFANTYNDGENDVTVYYARTWDYDIIFVDLYKYGNGWVAIDLPLDKFTHTGNLDLSEVEYIQMAIGGWSINGNGKPAAGADKFDIRFASIAAVSYGEKDETKNGINGGLFFENGEISTGWKEVGGINYYFDPFTGKMATGLTYVKEPLAIAPAAISEVEGKYYVFSDTGVLIGEANGMIETEIPVLGDDGKYQLTTVNRIYSSGAVATGLSTVGGSNYYADPITGAVITNDTRVIDGVILSFDENGVASVYTGWFTDDDGKTYYSDSYIGLAVDLVKIEGNYYYFDTVTFEMLKNGWVEDYNMYFGADGKAAEGMVENVVKGDETKTMFFKTGFPYGPYEYVVESENKKYVFDAEGVLTEVVDLTVANVTVVMVKDGVQTELKNEEVTLGDRFTYLPDTYPCYVIEIYRGDTKLEDTSIDFEVTAYVNNYTIRYVSYDDAGLKHRFDGGTQIKEVACGVDGEMLYTCRDCGKTFTAIIERLTDHEYDLDGDGVDEIHVTVEPGCATTGEGYKECVRCHSVDSRIDVVIPATEAHNYSAELRYNPDEPIYYDHHYYECEVCGKKLDPEHHTFSEWTLADDSTHTRECTVCGYVETANHVFEDRFDAENHWQLCTVCGATTATISHTIVWTSNADGHFKSCENCDYATELTAHTPVTTIEAQESTCVVNGHTAQIKCSDCGYLIQESVELELVAHTPSEAYSYDATYHWKVCTVCAAEIEKGVHTPDMNNLTDIDDEEGTANAKCTVCDHNVAVTIETWYEKLGMTKVDGKYYFSGLTDGLRKFEDGWRYFGADGALVLTGLDGENAFNGTRGVLKTTLVPTADGKYYILDGEMVTNCWFTISDKEYFFNDQGKLVTPAVGETTIVANGIICNVEADGAHILGVYDNGDGTYSYYVDGVAGCAKSMFIKSPSNRVYYADLNGHLVTGLQVIDDVYYQFGEDYVLIRQCRNEMVTIDVVDNVYVNADGKAVKSDWVILGANEYYADENGVLVTGELVLIGGIYYDFDETGVYLGKHTGWMDGGAKYMFNGVYVVREFATISGNTYYFDANGNKVCGKSIFARGTNYPYGVYTFDEQGVKIESITEGWVDLNGATGYVVNSELVKSTSMTIDGNVYMFNEYGYRYENCSGEIDGTTYWFDAEGIGWKVTEE